MEHNNYSRRNFSPEDVKGGDIESFGKIFEGLIENNAGVLSEIDNLKGPLKGIIFWVLAHYGFAVPEKRLVLLLESHTLLGDRHIFCYDLGCEYKSRNDIENAAKALGIDTEGKSEDELKTEIATIVG